MRCAHFDFSMMLFLIKARGRPYFPRTPFLSMAAFRCWVALSCGRAAGCGVVQARSLSC